MPRLRAYIFWCLVLGLVVPNSWGNDAANPRTSVRHTASGEKLHIPGIHDAGRVGPFLYRGAQPNDQGLRELKRLGINTIVDLRGERKDLIEKERKHAETLGMRFVNLPGNGWSPPSDKQIAEFFSLLHEQPQRRTFVHCWFGGDRSGVFVAAYRIAFDGWTPEEAIREMHQFHFKSFWHPAMTRYVRDFPARLRRTPSLAGFRHSRVSEERFEGGEPRFLLSRGNLARNLRKAS
jgi:protein tyrosine phosphatase (PTP) superfamily phosphohydrolase (DUF442 family)